MNASSPARLGWNELLELAPDAYKALMSLAHAVEGSGLEMKLVDLIKLRASQVNGCAFCVQMHTLSLRKLGESEDRLTLLPVWREAPVFTERERAALAWTEAVTLISEDGVPDELYAQVSAIFSAKELAYLTAAVVMINSWNRFGVTFRFPPQLQAAQSK